MTEELAQPDITQLLRELGDEVNEGQPEQLAGRWIENGFEDPDEVRAWIDAGVVDPGEARARVERGDRPAGAGDRHEDAASHGRDVVRGTTESRSRPGDDLEREPQAPGSPP